MTFLTELRKCVDVLSAHPELDVEPGQLLARLRESGGDATVAVLTDAAAVTHCVDRVKTVAAAVIGELSTRDRGQGGFAATKGHRSPVSFVQSISGGTRAEAVRAVRLGESLVDASPATDTVDGTSPDADADPHSNQTPRATDDTAARTSWHDGLCRAMLCGTITELQQDAILRGLGEPPIGDGDRRPTDAAVEVWALAAEQLMAEARTGVPIEELAARSRTVRDVLDPVGAEERFQRRYDHRSFRMWSGADGVSQAHIVFDDEMAAWVRSVIDAALRPRRGGPRFVDAEETAAANALSEDPRTDDQLTYDLMIDVMRAGALADAATVFGARQPGVRLVVISDAIGRRDAFGRMLATGHCEDGGQALPGTIIDRNACMNGYRQVTIDAGGNPLDVGREQRLFTARQRIALAVRDGGCLWPECRTPVSYCEAHHADHWEQGGATDLDRGLLLCRFHHMALHHHGRRVSRDGDGPFVLHPPPGATGKPVVLRSKAAWRWAWNPPPDRPRWREGGTRPASAPRLGPGTAP